jgi:hypothetical protein
MMHAAYTAARHPNLVPRLAAQKLAGRWSHWQDGRKIARIVPAIPALPGGPAPADWNVQRVEWPQWSRTGVTVAFAGPQGCAPRAVVKVPHTRQGIAGLRRQQRILAALHADPRLAGLGSLLPRPLGLGALGGQFYALETALPGMAATRLMGDPGAGPRLQVAAADLLWRLHEPTTRSVAVTSGRLARWVDAPMATIGRVVPQLTNPAGHAALQRLGIEVRAALAGRRVAVSWIHGDFWPGNLLVGPDGAITGIVDWERAEAGALPLHDSLHLLLFTRKQVRQCGEADVVAALGAGIAWTPAERELLDRAQSGLPGAPLAERTAVLLYWLRHTAATLALLPEYGRNRDYLRDNIEAVLCHL